MDERKLKYRKHVRLPHFDYSSPGYYFATLCTNFRKCLFAPAVSSNYGHKIDVVAASYAAEQIRNTKHTEEVLKRLEKDYYENLLVDFYCIMPDHVHVVFGFEDAVYKKGAIRSRHYGLEDVVRSFKAIVSREFGFPVWQPNYYEHVIRSEGSLDRIRNYILANPDVSTPDWKFLDPRS